jgi:chromate transporter
MASAAPVTFRSWLWINFKVGALSFGSVSRVLIYEDEVVRIRGWLTDEQFYESLTLAQILPGPNLVNLASAVGYRLFPKPVAVLALLPLIIPGAILAILVALFVPMNLPWVRDLFQGFAVGALLLMVRFLWKLFLGLSAATPTQLALPDYHQTQRRKTLGRYALVAVIAFLFSRGVPVLPLVLGGVAVCLAWEFAL